ncbi:hypothetical protein NDU88_000868 [Pleurodeles waltl]|uniref:Secreted protein n=1 Tax=Pleurodeles waltl TaxID=8319 RepID=A0AAV7P5F1_PLEWA|nr:hypothetical protein NDU88_000868 [Pleurodeles waltl]
MPEIIAVFGFVVAYSRPCYRVILCRCRYTGSLDGKRPCRQRLTETWNRRAETPPVFVSGVNLQCWKYREENSP